MPAGAFFDEKLYFLRLCILFLVKNYVFGALHARRGLFCEKIRFCGSACPQGPFCVKKYVFSSSGVPKKAPFLCKIMFFRPQACRRRLFWVKNYINVDIILEMDLRNKK